MALKWPSMCWCAVKKLLTDSLQQYLVSRNVDSQSRHHYRRSSSSRSSSPALRRRHRNCTSSMARCRLKTSGLTTSTVQRRMVGLTRRKLRILLPTTALFGRQSKTSTFGHYWWSSHRGCADEDSTWPVCWNVSPGTSQDGACICCVLTSGNSWS